MTIRHSLIVAAIAATFAAGACRRTSGEASAASAGAASEEPVRLQLYKNPTPVPAVHLTDLDGKPISSADWRGKVTLVNFWATWCPPCRAEIPELIKLQDKYRDQLQIVGISEDDAPPEVVRAFVTANRMNYPVAMTTPEVEKAFPGVAALPTTYVIDKHGNVVQRHVGMLPPGRTELEARVLAGLPTNATVEEVDRAQPMKLDNAAQIKSIPGVDLAALPPAKRAEALQKLNSEGCTCGCDLTVARCRVEDPNCGVSLPLAKKILEELKN